MYERIQRLLIRLSHPPFFANRFNQAYLFVSISKHGAISFQFFFFSFLSFIIGYVFAWVRLDIIARAILHVVHVV